LGGAFVYLRERERRKFKKRKKKGEGVEIEFADQPLLRCDYQMSILFLDLVFPKSESIEQ
jgi:hypothetical protein